MVKSLSMWLIIVLKLPYLFVIVVLHSSCDVCMHVTAATCRH